MDSRLDEGSSGGSHRKNGSSGTSRAGGKRSANSTSLGLDSRRGKRRQSDSTENLECQEFLQLLAEFGVHSEGSLYPDGDFEDFIIKLQEKIMLDRDFLQVFLAKFKAMASSTSGIDMLLSTPPRDTSEDENFLCSLLSCQTIQGGLVGILIEILADCLDIDMEPEEYNTSTAKMIIQCLQSQDLIEECNTAVRSIAEILPACPQPLQVDMILLLPHLSSHPDAVEVTELLKQMLDTNSSLSSTIFKAFSTIALLPEDLQDVMDKVMKRLAVMNEEDIPDALTFLLKSTAVKSQGKTIRHIRNQLGNAIFLLQKADSSLNRKGKGKAHEVSVAHLVLDAMAPCFEFSKSLCCAFVQEFVNRFQSARPTNSGSFRYGCIDLWMFVSVYGACDSVRKQMESALISWLNESPSRNAEECCSALGQRKDLVVGRDLTVIELGFNILSNEMGNSESEKVASFLLQMVFTVSQIDRIHRQIISRLVEMVTMGQKSHSSRALRTLKSISEAGALQMLKYTKQCEGLLDYLYGMEASEVQLLFETLANLALSCGGTDRDSVNGTSIADTLQILLRKQLCSHDLNVKKLGLFGVFALIRQLSKKLNPEEEAKPIKSLPYSGFTDLLDLAIVHCQNEPRAAAYLWSSLSKFLKQDEASLSLVSWICDSSLKIFESMSFIDLDEEGKPVGHQASCLWYNLDGAEAPVTLNVYPALASNQEHKLLVYLPFLFKVAAVSSLRLNGNLDNVDAVLGCPILLFDISEIEKFSSLSQRQKSHILLSLYYSLNWFRELLNTFCVSDGERPYQDRKIKDAFARKILVRVGNFLMLERMFHHLVVMAPGLQLPDYRKPLESHKSFKELFGNTKDDSLRQGSTSSKALLMPNERVALFRSQMMCPLEVHTLRMLSVIAAGIDDKPTLSLHFAEFILAEHRQKIASIIKSRSKEHSKARTSQGSHDCADGIVTEIVKELPSLKKFLDFAIADVENQPTDSEGVINEEPEITSLSMVEYQLCHRMDLASFIQLILSYIQDVVNLSATESKSERRFSVWAAFCKEQRTHTSNTDEQRKATLGAYKFFSDLVERNTPSTFVGQCQLLSLLQALGTDLLRFGRDCRDDIRGFAQGILCRKYPDLTEKESLRLLIDIYVSSSTEPIATLDTISANVIGKENIESNPQGESIYPSYNSSNSLNWYQFLFQQLLKHWKQATTSFDKDNSDEKDNEKTIENFQKCGSIFCRLVITTKAFEKKTQFICTAMKFGQKFLEVVLKAEPIFRNLLKFDKEILFKFFTKGMQQGTRHLQILCSEGKVRKQKSLVNLVPSLKRVLERYVFLVKTIAAQADATEAFHIGHLKPRNIRGETCTRDY